MRSNRKFYISLIFVLLITLFGFWLRFKTIYPDNIIFDYDQYEELFLTKKIAVDKKLVIIGRAIYGNPNLHHGVFYNYYNIIPFIIFKGNPVNIALWNGIFNAATSFVLFFLAKSLFKRILPGIIAAILVSVSPEFIQYSGWISIPTTTLTTVPLFFLGLWQYYQGKNWGLPLSALTLGLAIQSDLMFLYLILIIPIYYLIFRPKLPKLKTAMFSISLFIFSISTLILTEIKLKFAGIFSFLHFNQTFSTDINITYPERLKLFLKNLYYHFSYNLLPNRPKEGVILTLIILIGLLFALFKSSSKIEKKAIYFLLLYFLSPSLMLILGYHDHPWFFISLPPAILLLAAYLMSKINFTLLSILIVTVVTLNNTNYILNNLEHPHTFFQSDPSTELSSQVAVMDYTYRESHGLPFAINTVTYPLYYNGLWAYNYDWYGKSKYGSLPYWLGGDQLYPYNILPKSRGSEKFFYLISDNTSRIPDIYRQIGKKWALLKGNLLEERDIGGFNVERLENIDYE